MRIELVRQHRRSLIAGVFLVVGSLWLPAVLAAEAAAERPLTASVGDGTVRFHPVDLSQHYHKKWDDIQPATSWSAIPRGLQTLDGVPFNLGGFMEITGMGAVNAGRVFPSRVSGITVGRKATTIHLLHGAGYETSDGTPMAKLVVRYANGEERSLPIQYGVHVRNWWKERRETKEELSDTDSRVAWTGTSLETDQLGATLRLFHTRLRNPLPDQEIQSLDFVSLFSRATPVLVGLTVEEGGASPAKSVAQAAPPPATEGAEPAGETRLQFVDATSGQALPGATVKFTVADERASYFFGEHKTDAQGRATLDYPVKQITSVTIEARAPGCATIRQQHLISELPRDLTVKLERGVPIGGVIHDEHGQPIADAKIQIDGVVRDEVGQSIVAELDSVMSDRDGQWTSSALSKPEGLSFRLSHAEFMPTEYDQATADNAAGNVVTTESLLARKAVMVMPSGIAVEGTVTDDRGQPLAGAEVVLASGENLINQRRARTDSAGQFRLVVTEPGEAHLVVKSKGRAPRYQPVEIAGGLKPFTLELSGSKVIKGRVLDTEGAPVSGAGISVDSWHDLPLLKWQGRSDREGRFTWDAAPDEPVRLLIGKTGFVNTVQEVAPGDEVTIQLPKSFLLTGKVVDAETKEAITSFRIMRGYTYDLTDAAPVNWERGAQVSGRDGSYSIRLDSRQGGQARFMATADGYLPAASPALSESGWHTFDFELQRITVKAGEPTRITYGGTGRPIIGKVVLSDPDREVDWNQGHHSLNTKWPQPPKRFETPEEGRAWNNSPEVKAARDNSRYYAFRFAPEGTFRIDDVPAGTYELTINLTEPGGTTPGMGVPIGSLRKEVVVPDMPDGRSDEPLDLGELKLHISLPKL